MPQYPQLNIGSKNILMKRLAPNEKAKDLEDIKDLWEHCIEKFDDLWWDHKSQSKPEKKKWVRDCSSSRLSRLLKRIDTRLLKPQDSLVPIFIHGGVSGKYRKHTGYELKKSTHSAGISLIDGRKNRWLLKLDLKRFFEQVSRERVFTLFRSKLRCSEGIAHKLADLCCVPEGPKKSPSKQKTIARGFATSVRLAIWCNIDFFFALKVLVEKELKGHFPLMAIFIDDIGITATNVSEDQLRTLARKIEKLAENHGLIINLEKTAMETPTQIFEEFGTNKETVTNKKKTGFFEHLGLGLTRKKIFISQKTAQKFKKCKEGLQSSTDENERKKLKATHLGLRRYQKHTQAVSTS